MIKSSSLLIAAIINAVGVILLAIWEFLTYPIPNPAPPFDERQQHDEMKERKRDEITTIPDVISPPLNQAVNVSGSWHGNEGNIVQITRDGSIIGVDMEVISDDVPYQLSGTGSLVDQVVKLTLDCRMVGIFIGQMPATLAFKNSEKAVVTIMFAGAPISTELHR